VVQRGEVGWWGAEGAGEATGAGRLFDRLKGVSWRGYYVRTDDGWVAAWVREVS